MNHNLTLWEPIFTLNSTSTQPQLNSPQLQLNFRSSSTKPHFKLFRQRVVVFIGDFVCWSVGLSSKNFENWKIEVLWLFSGCLCKGARRLFLQWQNLLKTFHTISFQQFVNNSTYILSRIFVEVILKICMKWAVKNCPKLLWS